MPLKNPRRELFALHLAAGKTAAAAYRDAGFAAGGAAQSAHRLFQSEEIQNRVAELRAEIGAKLIDATVRDVNARIERLQRRCDAMDTIVRERGESAEMQDIPGGRTGFVTLKFKLLGRGEDAKVIREHAVDGELLREMRAHEEQAARELGQYAEKHEISGPGGEPLAIGDPRLQRLNDDELKALEAMLRKATSDDDSHA